MKREVVGTGKAVSGLTYETECSVCRWRGYYQDPNLFRCEQCKRVNMAGMEYLYIVHHHDFWEIANTGGNRAYVVERAEHYALEEWWKQVRDQKLLVIEPPRVDTGVTFLRVQGTVVHE